MPLRIVNADSGQGLLLIKTADSFSGQPPGITSLLKSGVI